MAGYDFDFTRVVFDGGYFIRATFSGGTVKFSSAVFSSGEVYFGGATFSGGNVDFGGATFSGGRVSFRRVRDWSCPPILPKPVLAGVLLPEQEPNPVEAELKHPESREPVDGVAG